MKKILVFLAIVALVFCSFSCKTSEAAATEEPAPAETTAPAAAEPAQAPAPAAEPAQAPAAAVSAEAYEAAILYLQDIDLRAKVPESKKNVEPWTKGVQIFEMGQGLFYRAMYTDSLAPLGQTKKFWSGLCENPTDVPEEAIKAGVLYYEAQYYRDRVPEEKKSLEPYTKGVQIFGMGEQCIEKGMYADAIAPLAQAKKFWKGLCDAPAATAATFPEGKSVDSNWNAKWVFEGDNNVKLYDSESGALIYDFAGKTKDLKAEGNTLSFRCDETQRFYTFVRNGDTIEMDIDRDWTDEEYHVTMSAE